MTGNNPKVDVVNVDAHTKFGQILSICSYSLADSGVDLDLRCIENALTDYDSQHLQKQEST